ncbi:TIGR00645 family protein [soil metagenome]
MADLLPQLPTKPMMERGIESVLFASRWLMTPFYLGLILALAALIVVFFQELAHEIPRLFGYHQGADFKPFKPEDAILLALSLIDLSLAANLVLIVIFSGYENFVSKIDVAEHKDRPEWMGTVDFSGLKLKLIASIVAISGIALLKAFLKLTEPTVALDEPRLMWLVIIHLTFVGSGVLLALMDLLQSKTSKH